MIIKSYCLSKFDKASESAHSAPKLFRSMMRFTPASDFPPPRSHRLFRTFRMHSSGFSSPVSSSVRPAPGFFPAYNLTGPEYRYPPAEPGNRSEPGRSSNSPMWWFSRHRLCSRSHKFFWPGSYLRIQPGRLLFPAFSRYFSTQGICTCKPYTWQTAFSRLNIRLHRIRIDLMLSTAFGTDDNHLDSSFFSS